MTTPRPFVTDDPYPIRNPFDGLGVHGCDGCCRKPAEKPQEAR